MSQLGGAERDWNSALIELLAKSDTLRKELNNIRFVTAEIASALSGLLDDHHTMAWDVEHLNETQEAGRRALAAYHRWAEGT